VATLIGVYANISFAKISGIGWEWAGVIWLYSLIFYVPLDIIKFTVRYALTGDAWKLIFERKTAFTSKKDYGKEDRAAKWVLSQRTLQGLHLMAGGLEVNGRRSSIIAEQARRRAEIARYFSHHHHHHNHHHLSSSNSYKPILTVKMHQTLQAGGVAHSQRTC